MVHHKHISVKLRGSVAAVLVLSALFPLAAAPQEKAGDIPVSEVIRKFSEKEKEFRQARENYVYRQEVRVQELGLSDRVVGEFQMTTDVSFDDKGRRVEKVIYAPAPSLKNVSMTAEDFEHIRSIQQRFPDSPLYAMGISAGTGLLVRYLGEQGADTPIRAAMAYCPGYDINVAFARSRPFYSRMMAKKLIRQFVSRNQDQFGHLPSYSACSNARDLHELHQNPYEMAGYASREAFFADLNPVTSMRRLAIPLLILNAADDPVCHIQNVYEHRDVVGQIPQVILATTARGSHCAYFEGWRAQPWAHHLSADYFTAVNRLQAEKQA